MALRTKRTIISSREAASIYGVTPCRMRQLAVRGQVWSERIDDRFVFCLEEIEKKAAEMAAARAAGRVRGPAPSGGPAPRPSKKR